jgi:peptide/nickel transport system ATP-binding protein
VGLPADRRFQRRWPHQVSGGQQQRVALAAALAHRPRLLVLDEPTSALDLVTAGHLLTDIDRLRREQGLAVLLVSHDLAAVRRLADRVVVLARGQVTATGTVTEALTAVHAGEGSSAPAADEFTGRALADGELVVRQRLSRGHPAATTRDGAVT